MSLHSTMKFCINAISQISHFRPKFLFDTILEYRLKHFVGERNISSHSVNTLAVILVKDIRKTFPCSGRNDYWSLIVDVLYKKRNSFSKENRSISRLWMQIPPPPLQLIFHKTKIISKINYTTFRKVLDTVVLLRLIPTLSWENPIRRGVVQKSIIRRDKIHSCHQISALNLTAFCLSCKLGFLRCIFRDQSCLWPCCLKINTQIIFTLYRVIINSLCFWWLCCNCQVHRDILITLYLCILNVFIAFLVKVSYKIIFHLYEVFLIMITFITCSEKGRRLYFIYWISAHKCLSFSSSWGLFLHRMCVPWILILCPGKRVFMPCCS